ncbi:HET-domain-containing protein, partial [Rhizodiscina lignyota]
MHGGHASESPILSNTDVFVYQPLSISKKQIRLIRISGSGDGPIECLIRHVDLDATTQKWPTYRALSYTWGPATPSFEILINGKTKQVRQNLYNFLRILQRSQACHDELWIDQLCIDQETVTEKNQQVMMLSGIYSSASEVIVWLGLLDSENDTTMRYLVKHSRGTYNPSGMYGSLESPSDWSNIQPAVQRFFAIDYWERLWIVQELLLA